MKVIKSLTLSLCAVALIASINLANADDKKVEKKGCCEATVEAGKKCDHKCCVKQADAGKVCKKCHKEEKKAEKTEKKA